MNPIGKKKCSYNPMQKKGLISPVALKTKYYGGPGEDEAKFSSYTEGKENVSTHKSVDFTKHGFNSFSDAVKYRDKMKSANPSNWRSKPGMEALQADINTRLTRPSAEQSVPVEQLQMERIESKGIKQIDPILPNLRTIESTPATPATPSLIDPITPEKPDPEKPGFIRRVVDAVGDIDINLPTRNPKSKYLRNGKFMKNPKTNRNFQGRRN